MSGENGNTHNFLNDPNFQAITKYYKPQIREWIQNAPPEKLEREGVPNAIFSAEIIQAVSVMFQKDFTQFILRRMVEGKNCRDAVHLAQKDFGISLDDRSFETIVASMEESFKREAEQKDLGGVSIEIVSDRVRK